MNIVLIGFMGSGKTTISSQLAKKLQLNYLEMDDLVLKKSKRKDINQIFAIDGELKFRELEITVSKQLIKSKNTVISTGGGVVMNKIIIDYLKKSGLIIFLETSFAEIEKRLNSDRSRPLFKNKNQSKELFKLRQPLYKVYSNLTIKTDGQTVNKIIKNIITEKTNYEN